MKKRMISLVLVLVLLLGALPASAAGGRSVITVNPITIEVGGKSFDPVDVNGQPVHVFEYGGTTYAPLRALAEAYGLTVGYDAAQNLATVEGTVELTDYHGKRGTVMTAPFQLIVSPISVMVNGTIFQPRDATGAAVAVFESGGTTYAPLRALAEAYGLKVGYNAERRLAYVYTEGAEPVFATAPAGGTIIDDPLGAADMDQAATSPYIVQDVLMFTNNMLSGYLYSSGKRAVPENGSAWRLDNESYNTREYYKEYAEALAANGFEMLAVEDEGSGRYAAALVSTRVDTERTVKAYVDGEDIYCDVYVNTSYPGIQWGDEFDLGDMGLRSQLVENRRKNWSEVEGYYAADAFYRRGTEYANLSDSFLTTNPGGATLIINDTMRATGDASIVHDIETHIKPDLAILKITGFEGDKEIRISLPVNGTVADGDVFTLADFYHNGSAGDRTNDLENGSGYGATVMYLPYGSGDYIHRSAGSMYSFTVRVIEWDESGESDSVIYFNIEVDDGNGAPYNVEGLAAAPIMPEEPVHENTAQMAVGTTMTLRFGYDSGATVETYEWSLVTGTAVEFVGETNGREVTIQAVTTGEVEVMCRYRYLVDSTDVLTGNPTRETKVKTERFWIEVS